MLNSYNLYDDLYSSQAEFRDTFFNDISTWNFLGLGNCRILPHGAQRRWIYQSINQLSNRLIDKSSSQSTNIIIYLRMNIALQNLQTDILCRNCLRDVWYSAIVFSANYFPLAHENQPLLSVGIIFTGATPHCLAWYYITSSWPNIVS